jgi:cell division septum initiation protein DivIVA
MLYLHNYELRANQMTIYSKKISFDVVSKGRKYFKIRYSPEHNEFQLVINDLTKQYKAGDRVEDLLCEFETQINSYTGGKKTTATAVDSAANIKSEIIRWSGYCEKAAIEGRDYQKGLAKLVELGATDKADQFKRQASDVRSNAKQQEQAVVAKKQEQEKVEGITTYYFCSPTWSGAKQTHLQVGDLYKQEGIWYKILTRSYRRIKEDGLSLGLADDEGETIRGKARVATESESAPYIAAKAERIAVKVERDRQTKERADLAKQIETNGERPQPEQSILLGGQEYLSTQNIYGGGDWFVIDREANEIWYVENNGTDGGNWSWNNIRTGGAGAIGWKINYDLAIANRILALAGEPPHLAPDLLEIWDGKATPTPSDKPEEKLLICKEKINEVD